jgi:hypothetical protein
MQVSKQEATWDREDDKILDAIGLDGMRPHRVRVERFGAPIKLFG